jgi:hypothetical protein
MQDREALFEDWKTKHEAIGALVTKYFGHSWAAWGDKPRTKGDPARPLNENVIREFKEAREAEVVALQALVDCVERGG